MGPMALISAAAALRRLGAAEFVTEAHGELVAGRVRLMTESDAIGFI
jgi:hypothetical protein